MQTSQGMSSSYLRHGHSNGIMYMEEHHVGIEVKAQFENLLFTLL